MYSNIEKREDLEVVYDNSKYQPNVIRLKSSSKANLLTNKLNVQAAIISKVENTDIEEPVVEKSETQDTIKFETKTALFHIDKTDSAILEGDKPINLTPNMMSNVRKKQNMLLSSLENVVSETEPSLEEEKLDEMFNAMDRVMEPEIDNSKVQEVSISTTASNPLEDLEKLAREFSQSIKEATQAERDFLTAKSQYDEASSELVRVTEAVKEEKVKNYDLESKVKLAIEEQKRILTSRLPQEEAKIADFKTAKASIDMEKAKVDSELENKKDELINVKSTNESLMEIYAAITNSMNETSENELDVRRRHVA